MKQAYDLERDVMTMTYSDAPVVRTVQYRFASALHTVYVDTSNDTIKVEVQNYSKFLERKLEDRSDDLHADPYDKTVIGSLDWTIIDDRSTEILSEGHTDVELRSVSFRICDGYKNEYLLSHKIFPLSDHFSVELQTRVQSTSDITAFALSLERDDMQTSGWNPFDVCSSDQAIERQDKGELRIDIRNPGAGWEIVHTEFMTDVSLRLKQFMPNRTVNPPTWRVNIRKGSVVNWPSLVDGKVVLSR